MTIARHACRRVLGTAGMAELSLPRDLVEALDDDSLDRELHSGTDEALRITGKDVGTPIIHFQTPARLAFLGPVISRLPREDEAVAFWDHVIGLAAFRVSPSWGEVGVEEDWHGGSRRAKR